MRKEIPYTETASLAAPMAAQVAQHRGVIKSVDHRKKQERRRVRRQERRAWRREAELSLSDYDYMDTARGPQPLAG